MTVTRRAVRQQVGIRPGGAGADAAASPPLTGRANDAIGGGHEHRDLHLPDLHYPLT
jgi:hypothetical protein